MSKKNKKSKNKKKKKYSKISDYKSEPRYGMSKNQSITQNIQSLSVMHKRTDKILSSKIISNYCTEILFNNKAVSFKNNKKICDFLRKKKKVKLCYGKRKAKEKSSYSLQKLKDVKKHRIKSFRLSLVKIVLKTKGG